MGRDSGSDIEKRREGSQPRGMLGEGSTELGFLIWNLPSQEAQRELDKEAGDDLV